MRSSTAASVASVWTFMRPSRGHIVLHQVLLLLHSPTPFNRRGPWLPKFRIYLQCVVPGLSGSARPAVLLYAAFCSGRAVARMPCSAATRMSTLASVNRSSGPRGASVVNGGS